MRFLAGFAFEKIDIDDVALRDAMLSAACFDNCVSHTRRECFGGKAAQSSHRCAALTRGKPDM